MTYPPMPEKIKKARKPLSEAAPDVILAVLAVAGLVISGWSLGTLLHDTAGAPWPVAGFAVAVFDLVAMAACMLVYARRHDPWSAAGARLVMTGALLASAVVNGAHGYALGGWTAAVVLAAAPLSFEVVFELRHRTLTALIWIMFRKEATSRLKHDAWTRIAIPVGSGRMTLDGSPADVADTIRRIESASPDRSGSAFAVSGSVKDQVADLIRQGVTDPAAVIAALPDANAETVKRMVRMHKNGVR
ncbi:hypothetical protein ABT121_42115 [Streptomyces sp. NPDC001928]|uniref:hypothetical protein n=1 Tax=Streptomyces sp. NPDC001928 TaxID=3154404 RepID=UPI0033252991